MRYKEFCLKVFEGREWTANDEKHFLDTQIASADNFQASYVYAPEVQLTDAVKLLAVRAECKWFFDFLTIKLHELTTSGLNDLVFYLYEHDDEWHLFVESDTGEFFVFPSTKNHTFPITAISIRALNVGGFWHVSMVL
jgi:hypothetical protein